MTHHLKCWPAPFAALKSGKKRHEIRSTCDRVFAVGDTLVLYEFDPETEDASGDRLRVKVTYLTPGGSWGLPTDLCVMSVEKI